MDAWTSPNSKAYIAVTIHLEQNGVPLCMLLDLVEVAESHSGLNLGLAFAKILNNFRITDKVSTIIYFNFTLVYSPLSRSLALHVTMPPQTMP